MCWWPKNFRKQSVPGRKVGYGVKWTEEQNVLRGKVCWAANCAEEQGVMRSNGCWEANCAEEKRVLGSKGGWGVKCSKEKNIPVGKVCWGVKCVKKQTVTSQFEANCSFEQKITMQRVPKQENVLRSKVCLSHVLWVQWDEDFSRGSFLF